MPHTHHIEVAFSGNSVNRRGTASPSQGTLIMNSADYPLLGPDAEKDVAEEPTVADETPLQADELHA